LGHGPSYRPHAATIEVVDQANAIIEEYSRQGFTLTLRQLLSQFVARGLLENAFKQYRRLRGIIRDARATAGLLTGTPSRTAPAWPIIMQYGMARQI
jgi:hypothetical protein